MSNVMVAPEFVRQAAGQLQNIGSSLTEANAAASTPTTAVLAPASDEVSAAITALMGTHAQQFQAVSAQAAKFHSQFVGVLNAGAASYASAEADNLAMLLEGFSGNRDVLSEIIAVFLLQADDAGENAEMTANRLQAVIAASNAYNDAYREALALGLSEEEVQALANQKFESLLGETLEQANLVGVQVPGN